MKIAILGSTQGTDLIGILQALEDGRLKDIEIAFVLSNKKKSGILKKARDHGLLGIYLDPAAAGEDYDARITDLLVKHDVELVVLVGYMKLMSREFVDRWRNRVMNIHPSLLPAFAGGMNKSVHAAVLERGCKITGASLIFIDHGADTGPIISQRVVGVEVGDDVLSLKAKVQAVEQEMLVEAIGLYRDGRIRVGENGMVLIT